MFKVKLGILPRLFIAIAVGIGVGLLAPGPVIRALNCFRDTFGQFIRFFVPFIVLGLVAPAIAETGKGAGYGYGLFVALTEDGSQVFYHTGNVPGFTSFVGYFPAEDYFVAVISNYAAENTMAVANKLTELFRARITP